MTVKLYIKDACKSNLQQEKHIPEIRSKLYKRLFEFYQKLHQNPSELTVDAAAKEYEQAIKDQIQLVDQLYSIPIYRAEREEYLQLYSIWSFCNLLFFDSFENNHELSVALMQWYNKTNRRAFYEYNTVNIFTQHPLDHPDFWPYLIRMATLGELQIIANTLHRVLSLCQKEDDTNLYSYFRELREMLRDTDYSTITSRNKIDRTRLLQWMQALSKDSNHSKQFWTLLAILTGNDESIIKQHAQDELHAFICCFYFNPDRYTSTTSIYEMAIKEFDKVPQDIYKSLLVGNLTQAIQESINYDWCFLAHLVDLFVLKNKLEMKTVNVHVSDGSIVTVPVQYHFILFYASFIKNNFGLWETAFNYMLTCDEWGREALVEHLKETDLNTENTIFQAIVQFCMKHNLEEIGLGLLEKKANSCLETKDYKAAINYYQQIKSSNEIDHVFYAIIEDYTKTQTLFDLSDLNICKGICYKVYRYLWHMQSLELDNIAVELFKELIHDDCTPISLLPLILWQGLQFLEDQSKFSQLSKLDLLQVKKQWQKLNNSDLKSNFELFHHFHQSLNHTTDSVEASMLEFLNETGVCFCKALEMKE
ncbi:nucleoporin Nup85-like protein [Cokeromyces recurvatus]|uniref:nucleoporin Nup85-like protein n=1 Tax=Cokeromyces recurvatus TaxID=90255 RepID=UPI00221E624E|nr:nucleoporin Nup85-like protein [Cokeromyces recurvatus]KAI7905732.1 nucleoporin Nup85-like protein [Cokeromyces recurvatus]